jgi:hypothetical protein
MELIKIAEQMKALIDDLSKLRLSLKVFGGQKSEAIANYERSIARTIIQLKNGIKFDLDGQEIQNPPTTITEKIAKGICWQEKLKAEETEMMYKSLITNIEVIKSQLNALQSINRNLESN